MPDLSGGIIAEIVEHPTASWAEWPISGDAITLRPGDALIHLVDWESMEGEE